MLSKDHISMGNVKHVKYPIPYKHGGLAVIIFLLSG